MTVLTLNLQFFEAPPVYTENRKAQVKKKHKEDDDRTLVCRNCKHQIATEGDRIVINQSHMHTCKNPSGLVFTFGCFSVAPGCVTAGHASTEFTWFPGYAWQIAICGNCGVHLGWLFRNSDQFYALITDRLINQ